MIVFACGGPCENHERHRGYRSSAFHVLSLAVQEGASHLDGGPISPAPVPPPLTRNVSTKGRIR